MIRILWIAFWFICTVLAIVGARPYAGGWNDGSRLASVEAIVDYDTLAIDDSIFVRVRPESPAFADPLCQANGTCDKLLIDGHFYTDKPAGISFLMAGVYQTWRWSGGPAFAERPGLVIRIMTWVTSGVAFLATLVCVNALGIRLGVASPHRLLLCASLAFATIAPIYTQHVNNHILLLAVSAALMWQLVVFGQEPRNGTASSWRLAITGGLAGVGYVLDLGLGPVLMMSLALAVFWRTRSIRSVIWCGLGALPFLAAHHALNYAIGGTFAPVNTVPEYLAWPGSPFDPSNMTGVLRHGVGKLIEYSAALLAGKHGFLGHNLPLFLAIFAAFTAWRTLPEHRPELVFGVVWCIGGWLMYAVFSNNSGGVCRSIRWFVPFLAPAYYWLALLLRSQAKYSRDLIVLTVWGAVLTAMWIPGGPWSNRISIFYWPIQIAAFASWWWIRKQSRKPDQSRRDTKMPTPARAA